MTYDIAHITYDDCVSAPIDVQGVNAEYCSLFIAPAAILPVAPSDLCRMETRLRWAQQAHAALFTCGMVGAANLIFLVSHFSHGQGALLLLAMVALTVSLPLTPAIWLWKRRTQGTRNEMVRKFSALGLQVDAQGVVMTNEPHPRIVHDPRTTFAAGQSAVVLPIAA